MGLHFGDLLRRAREHAGLSRAALARSIDFDPSYIHRLEAGSRRPSREAVLALADAMRLKSEDLSTWLTAAGFADLPLQLAGGSSARTRSVLRNSRSLTDEPRFQLVGQWSNWLEAMGFQPEMIAPILQGMETTGMAERRRVTELVSGTFTYLARMLEAPVRTAVIPAASGHLMVASHVIQRLLLKAIGEAAQAGISKVVLVIAPGMEPSFYAPLREALDVSIAPSVKLEYALQPRPEGLGDAVLQAEKFVGDHPFALILPDELLDERSGKEENSHVLRSMMMAFSELPDGSLVAVKSVPKSKMQRYGVARVGEQYQPGVFRIEELEEKPVPGSLISHSANAFGIVGRYLLRSDVFPALRRLKISGVRPLQLTSALELIRQKGKSIYAYDLKVGRQDIGEVLGKASNLFKALPPDQSA